MLCTEDVKIILTVREIVTSSVGYVSVYIPSFKLIEKINEAVLNIKI